MTKKIARIAIFNDTRSDQGHFGCQLVMDRLENLIHAAGGEVVFRLPFDRDWRQHRNDLPAKGDIDAIVVNGEGTMHGAPNRPNAVALAELAAFAKSEYGVPAILLNATLHNNDAQFYLALAQYDLVFLRDTMSCKEAASHGFFDAQYCPDLTLSIENPDKIAGRQGIGVTGSVKYHDDRALREFAKLNNADFVSMVRSYEPAFKTFLAPSIGKLRIAWRAHKRHNDIDHSIQPTSPQEFIDWICQRSLVITGRYHTVSLCILTKTPFIYVESNSPKISALCSDAGLREDRKVKSTAALMGSDELSAALSNGFDEIEMDAIVRFRQENKQRFDFLTGSLSKLFAVRR